jgi:branched-chain amino acid transport system ATP-binding protein
MLTIDNLSAGYDGAPAVRELTIEVAAGEIVALLGANGAGKTTTLNATIGLVEVYDGTITFDGRDVSGESVDAIARRGLAYVTEDRSLLPGLTVAESLRIVRNPVEDAQRWFPALTPLLNRKAGLLSGGEQQMLALGRAISSGPKLLMIDELSLGLAPRIVKEILARLSEFARERDTAVLLVEQHVAQALAVADRAYLLRDGRITDTGSAGDLLDRRDIIEASYLGAEVPEVDSTLAPHTGAV